ncbi:precorrin-3B synthase [Kribbella qitaiheensis]|uniref:Precorrin-3B synthase n=1 Tax=Kribbella qitaiheensis TaxID=1544730 RepID=A0A7G6WV20_9ACTN|nr:precorrin-3B synthase [Kribbella qitaiheensis]QNE17835.1 precorrin-3B synthase [Kribbella qitaiheensis]
MNSSPRTQPDSCPGVLAVHQAADGGLARVRLPGGLLSAAQLRVLAAASGELGDGHLELTSRGNIQIRALRPGAPQTLSDRLYSAGLLPSISHERVRNILASPLSGLDQDSLYDVLPLAAELDRLLCAQPALAELPGRFLFALDDGRGDLGAVGADVAVRVLAGGKGLLVLGGVSRGAEVPLEDAPAVMIAAAEAFLTERAAQDSEAWRIAELADGAAEVYERLGLEPRGLDPRGLDPRGLDPLGLDPLGLEPLVAAEAAGTAVVVAGRREQVDGRVAVVVTVPLGSLSAEQAAVLSDLAELGNGQIRVTPWRSVVLGGFDAVDDAVAQLEAVGLVVEPESPWNGVTACAGKPGCAKALADVRADARDVTPRIRRGRQPVHWSGCERRCGRPAGRFVDIIALGNGYAIDGEPVDVELVEAVAAARGAR